MLIKRWPSFEVSGKTNTLLTGPPRGGGATRAFYPGPHSAYGAPLCLWAPTKIDIL